MKRYKNNKIVIFPQTVLLTDKDVILRTQEAFNTHRNLILMCRDEVSLSNAQKLFTCRTLLFPDFVTSLIGNSEFAFGNKRADILFVLRNDGEKYYSDEELNINLLIYELILQIQPYNWECLNGLAIETIL